MPKDDSGINKTNNILRTIYQSLAIGGVVLTMLYFPVNSKIASLRKDVEAKIAMTDQNVNSIKEQHDKDCKSMIEDTKELKAEVEKKLERENLKIHLNPITKGLDELKGDLKDFKSEIIRILNKK